MVLKHFNKNPVSVSMEQSPSKEVLWWAFFYETESKIWAGLGWLDSSSQTHLFLSLTCWCGSALEASASTRQVLAMLPNYNARDVTR